MLSVSVCLAALLIGGLIWGGNYLVTFAIGRSTGLKDIAPESTLSEEATQGIIQKLAAAGPTSPGVDGECHCGSGADTV